MDFPASSNTVFYDRKRVEQRKTQTVVPAPKPQQTNRASTVTYKVGKATGHIHKLSYWVKA